MTAETKPATETKPRQRFVCRLWNLSYVTIDGVEHALYRDAQVDLDPTHPQVVTMVDLGHLAPLSGDPTPASPAAAPSPEPAQAPVAAQAEPAAAPEPAPAAPAEPPAPKSREPQGPKSRRGGKGS